MNEILEFLICQLQDLCECYACGTCGIDNLTPVKS